MTACSSTPGLCSAQLPAPSVPAAPPVLPPSPAGAWPRSAALLPAPAWKGSGQNPLISAAEPPQRPSPHPPTLTLCCWLRVAFSCCTSFLFSSSTWQGTGRSPEGSRQGWDHPHPSSPGRPLAHPWPTQLSPAPTVRSGIKQREEAQPQMVLPCQSSARCPGGRHLPRDKGASCRAPQVWDRDGGFVPATWGRGWG